MLAINFEQANVIYKAEGCYDLPVNVEEDNIDFLGRYKTLTSCWEPNEIEMEYIKQCIENNKKPKIYLTIVGDRQPPVCLTCNLYKENENE